MEPKRTILGVCIIPIVLAAFLGCGQKKEGIQFANAIVIEYTVNGELKQVTVNDAKEVKEILDTISIHHNENRAPGWIVRNRFTFKLANGQEIGRSLARKQILDSSDSGITLLNDTKFYEKINEILSKKEARKIDVLEDNK
jgi:hypothetical protein